MALFARVSSQTDSLRTLTLEHCIATAKNNSLIMQQAQKAQHIAVLARKDISATAYPLVKLEAGGVYSPVTLRHGYDPTITDQGQLSGQAVVEQPIYDGGIRGLRKTQGDLDIGRLNIEQLLAVKNLEFNVTHAFIEALSSQSEMSLRKSDESNLYDYYLLAKSLHAAGSADYTDVLSTQSRLLSDSLALNQTDQKLTANKLALAELIGNAGDTAFSLSGTLEDLIPQSGDRQGAMAYFDSLQNLELSSAQLDYKRSQFDISAIRREMIPNLSFIGDLGYLSSRDNLLLPTSERINGIGYEVGFSLGVPIFDWGIRKRRIQQLQLTSDSLQLQTEILKRSLLTQYRTTLAGLSSARNRLRLADAALSTASDNFDLMKAKYAGGSALTVEVLDAYQALTEARLSKLEILADMATLSALLRRINAHE